MKIEVKHSNKLKILFVTGPAKRTIKNMLQCEKLIYKKDT